MLFRSVSQSRYEMMERCHDYAFMKKRKSPPSRHMDKVVFDVRVEHWLRNTQTVRGNDGGWVWECVLIAFNGYDADMLENCGIPGKFIRL